MLQIYLAARQYYAHARGTVFFSFLLFCLCMCVTASWHTDSLFTFFKGCPICPIPYFPCWQEVINSWNFIVWKEPFSDNFSELTLQNCSRATFVFVLSTVKENSVRYAEKESSRENASGESDGSNVCVFACWHTLPNAYLLTQSALCLRASLQEGFGNAAIILGGIFGPLYKLYSTKKFEALLNQNPQAPEAIAYYTRRKEIQDRSFLLIPLSTPSVSVFVILY